MSPGTHVCPRASVDTYVSTTLSAEELQLVDETDGSMEHYQQIPPLKEYHREIVDTNVRPSTPQDFAKLFPSMNRLSIRHDEFTSDGNMNLRVDTAIPGRKRQTMQLFHLRMYDLAKREFSLRRYCRDSGRELCHSKRKFTEPAPESGRPKLQRSMTSAIKQLSGKPNFRRTNSGGSLFSSSSARRPGTSHSSSADEDDYFTRASGRGGDKKAAAPPEPTNTIKLEFSNYARVDVQRRGGKSAKRYEFDWWGHRYTWKRTTDKHLGVVNFHLLRDGKEKPIAHIVPETRSPNQVTADEKANGWIPPCHMWITDKSIVNAVTDVADVIVATGLIALVDDCIKECFEAKKTHHIPVPLTTKQLQYVGPKTFMQQIFRRNSSDRQHAASPPRYRDAVAAH
jgi:hypothetical protein